LLAVAASILEDHCKMVLTDENIEAIDFDLKANLAGISAMTSYVNRGYEIADRFRAKNARGGDGWRAPELHAEGSPVALRRGRHRRSRTRDRQTARRPEAREHARDL
jgi:hypothetical protein